MHRRLAELHLVPLTQASSSKGSSCSRGRAGMQRWRALCAMAVTAAVLLAAACVPAQAVSMYQPGLGSILKASRPPTLNNSASAPGPAPGTHAEGAPLNVYSTSASAVAACLPLSVKFYDAQRSGQVLLSLQQSSLTCACTHLC